MFAYAEATRLLERALDLVPQLAPDARHARELELLSSLPGVLAGVDGFGTSRMSAAHSRARDGVVVTRARARTGIRPFDGDVGVVPRRVRSSSCDGRGTPVCGRRRRRRLLGGREPLPPRHHCVLVGRPGRGSRHFTTVVDHFDPDSRRQHQLVFGHDPLVVCLSRLANTLWFLGRDADAVAACDAALEMAAEVGHPLSHDTAAIFACVLAIDLGDPVRLGRCTALLGSLGMDSLPHTTKREALLGLLDVHDGRWQVGLERISAALERCQGRTSIPATNRRSDASSWQPTS